VRDQDAVEIARRAAPKVRDQDAVEYVNDLASDHPRALRTRWRLPFQNRFVRRNASAAQRPNRKTSVGVDGKGATDGEPDRKHWHSSLSRDASAFDLPSGNR